jgi:hypothetical protein
MTAKAAPPLRFDPGMLDRLACPACRGDLQPAHSGLICAGCRRAYPILDGIPILIAERAEIPQKIR